MYNYALISKYNKTIIACWKTCELSLKDNRPGGDPIEVHGAAVCREPRLKRAAAIETGLKILADAKR